MYTKIVKKLFKKYSNKIDVTIVNTKIVITLDNMVLPYVEYDVNRSCVYTYDDLYHLYDMRVKPRKVNAIRFIKNCINEIGV